MKLTVEIKDGKFIYNYEIGNSKHNSTMDICADSLVRFTALLQMCNEAYRYQDKQWERDAMGKAWVEKQTKGVLTEKP